MSTEQASNGSGDVPERSIIGFVPELGIDGESAGREPAEVDEPTVAPPVEDISADATGDDTAGDDATGADTTSADATGGDVIDGDATGSGDGAVFYEDQVEPEYGILGVTLRELVIVGAWALAFIVSFFPVTDGGASVWTSGIVWILTIGVPTAAVFLVVLRRFSPEGIRRVGSLGIDQFASVAAAVACVAWAQLLWHQIAAGFETGALLVGWVPVVAVIATLALVAATVAAPLIPGLREDFEGRMETLAHRNADPVRPVIRRPRPTPAAADGADAASSQAAGETAAAQPASDRGIRSDPDGGGAVDVAIPVAADGRSGTESDEDVTRVIDLNRMPDAGRADIAAAPPAAAPASESGQNGVEYTDPIGALHEIFESNGTDVSVDDGASAGSDAPEAGRPGGEAEAPLRRNRSEHPRNVESDAQPFWILAGTERDVLDEQGQPLYRIGPSAWTLVIEDRDGAYVVRHDDGRIGYLHDLTDITKG